MESYLFSFQIMYTSQFWKIDPYDWFCGPGSQMVMSILVMQHFKLRISVIVSQLKYWLEASALSHSVTHTNTNAFTWYSACFKKSSLCKYGLIPLAFYISAYIFLYYAMYSTCVCVCVLQIYLVLCVLGHEKEPETHEWIQSHHS